MAFVGGILREGFSQRRRNGRDIQPTLASTSCHSRIALQPRDIPQISLFPFDHRLTFNKL
jgi:hypothetical protein